MYAYVKPRVAPNKPAIKITIILFFTNKNNNFNSSFIIMYCSTILVSSKFLFFLFSSI